MSGSHTFSLTATTKIGLSFHFAMPDVTRTGNGERKSENELSAETSTKIQNGGPKKERERRRQRKEFVPWLKSGGDEIANQTHILRLCFE